MAKIFAKYQEDDQGDKSKQICEDASQTAQKQISMNLNWTWSNVTLKNNETLRKDTIRLI